MMYSATEKIAALTNAKVEEIMRDRGWSRRRARRWLARREKR